jgi:hypothetical protein
MTSLRRTRHIAYAIELRGEDVLAGGGGPVKWHKQNSHSFTLISVSIPFHAEPYVSTPAFPMQTEIKISFIMTNNSEWIQEVSLQH